MQKQEQTTRQYDWANGQKVAVTATSAQSAALTSVSEVLVSVNTNMYITVGTNPTAANAAGSFYIPSGTVFHLQVTAGQKIAAIRDTADGSIYILPVA